MPWIRLDDQFADHPKMTLAGSLAQLLYVSGLAYASRYLTDGYIPSAAIPRLHVWDIAPVPDNMELAERLVKAGLWERTEGGYQIHDYLNYNPSRAQVEADREKARERMNKARSMKRSPDVSEMFAGSSPEQSAKCARSSDNPVPDPLPQREEDEEERAHEDFQGAMTRIRKAWEQHAGAAQLDSLTWNEIIKAVREGVEPALLILLVTRAADRELVRQNPDGWLRKVINDNRRGKHPIKTLSAFLEWEAKARGAPDKPKFLNKFR